MNDITYLPQLRVTCLRSLAAYVFEADRTLKLLASIKKVPMTPRERRALVEQQQKENDAYRDYQFARVELFKLASCDES